MRVTYFGTQGQVRMVYPNIQVFETKNKGMVALKHYEPPSARYFGTYHTVAIINLAPGEYLEWSEDAEWG